jgi:hypothetical protein
MKRRHYISIVSIVVAAGLFGAGALVVGQSKVSPQAIASSVTRTPELVERAWCVSAQNFDPQAASNRDPSQLLIAVPIISSAIGGVSVGRRLGVKWLADLHLLDDVGFGQFSVFGGGVSSPNMEKLAAQGLRYNRFHTTLLCSPTRAALLPAQSPRDRERQHHRGRDGI